MNRVRPQRRCARGAVAADPPALAAVGTAQAGYTRAANRAPRDHLVPAQAGGRDPSIHHRRLVLGGVYRRDIDEAPEFVEAPESADEALQSVLHKFITRLMKLLTCRRVLFEKEG